MNRLNSLPRPASRQKGVSLLAAMIFLIVLSLLAIVSIRGVTMQERMAGNTQDWNLAFQATESTLRDGEADARSPRVGGGLFNADCSLFAGLCAPSTTGIPVWQTLSATWVNYGSQTGANNPSVVSKQGGTATTTKSRYLIEDLGPVGGSLVVRSYASPRDMRAYRTTAKGFGNIANSDGVTPATNATLQSVYVY